VGDPVGAGVVEPLARPGGNATGLSIQQTDTAGSAWNSGCRPHGRTGQLSVLGLGSMPDRANKDYMGLIPFQNSRRIGVCYGRRRLRISFVTHG